MVGIGSSYSHGCEEVGILLSGHSWGFARLIWPGEDAVLKNSCHDCEKKASFLKLLS